MATISAEAPAGRRRRRRSIAPVRAGRRSSPPRVPASAMPAGTKVPHSDSAKGGAAARPCRPSARARRRRPAGSRRRPARAQRAAVSASSAAAQSAAADAMISMPMRKRARVPDPSDQPPAGRPNTAPTRVTIETAMPAVASDRPRSRCSAGTSGGTMPSWPAASTPIAVDQGNPSPGCRHADDPKGRARCQPTNKLFAKLRRPRSRAAPACRR